MDFYLAPLEGITGYLYRRIHREMFPGVDKYYMPFISPHHNGTMKNKERHDFHPDQNEGMPVVPQVLTNHAESFVMTARMLRDLGYEEVNLNFGCPYPTVVTKHKGAGFLEWPDEMRRFLDAVFSESDLPAISVKTRLASSANGEDANEKLFRMYEEYPIAELTIHPRLQKEMYRYEPDLAVFRKISEKSSLRICYNGNLYTPSDLRRFEEEFPNVPAVMLGRGLIRNPALVRECKGGAPLTKDELKAFHDRIAASYRIHFSGPSALIGHMKELWRYWETLLPASPKLYKALYKSRSEGEYFAAADAVFRSGEMMDTDESPRATAKLLLKDTSPSPYRTA